MKKYLVGLLFVVSSLFAVSGEGVYTKHCAACHQMKKSIHESGMKAPPFNMVSMRIKKMKGEDKSTFVAFVKDYIVNPSKTKGVCMPKAYKRFSTMPPIGKALSEDEREAVANWLYTHFKGSWDTSMGAKACESTNARSKKSSSKCGSK